MQDNIWTKCAHFGRCTLEEQDKELKDRIAELEKERDLAISHDRQPYPTAQAYEKVCEVLHKTKAKVEQLEKEKAEQAKEIKGLKELFKLLDTYCHTLNTDTLYTRFSWIDKNITTDRIRIIYNHVWISDNEAISWIEYLYPEHITTCNIWCKIKMKFQRGLNRVYS